MQNPFDILPLNIFNLFSTQGFGSLQRHYMAILLRLYALAEFNRFGLTREVVVDEIVHYLKEANAEGEIAAEMDSVRADLGVSPDSISITGQKSEHSAESELLLEGRLKRQAPEIDGKLLVNDLPEGFAPRPGAVVKVRVTEAHDYDVVGRVVA